MNIKQAKEYIENTAKLYLKKDESGEYRMPLVRQRPLFLLGAPGIGKTAIVEQVAQELGIALVSYSMTHHTRQSALGLPFITERVYGGETYSISEYTMSEIIAAVYDTMEAGGIKEGILFLDEINCVSETLAPAMLQFLQYKTFGRHRVPQGWVIVTAGNPPEYNRSVREFDVVTYDRLKVMEVEPDYAVWKEYAAERQIHSAVTGYLDLKTDHFYRMEMTAKGRSYVTARGWEDLSEILKLYEEEGLSADETLVGQYLRNTEVVKEFTAYYDLYRKYKSEYQIGDILDGRASAKTMEKAREAAFDERLSLLGMLLDKVQADMREAMEQAAVLTELKNPMKGMAALAEREEGSPGQIKEGSGPGQISERLKILAEGRRKQLESLRNANSLSDRDRKRHGAIIRFLEEGYRAVLTGEACDGKKAYLILKERFNGKTDELKRNTDRIRQELHALFSFVEEAFGQGNEMLILVTELTRNNASAQFIAAFGSPDYRRHSDEMMLSQRRDRIQAQIAELDLTDIL
ncbi:MAG TPA: ATPase [Lachnospiraceae bacterium]|nr:ATPase [Lachnospiraceae bacterium]